MEIKGGVVVFSLGNKNIVGRNIETVTDSVTRVKRYARGCSTCKRLTIGTRTYCTYGE